MLTLFAIPKAFTGHIGVIQDNALGSWARLRPACDVVLMGDDPGTAEAAARFGFRHAPEVRRNEFGTPLVDDLFRRAEQLSRTPLMAYVNADIILLDDFLPSIGRVASWRSSFLVVGQRWDLDVTSPVDFSAPWEAGLRRRLGQGGRLHPPSGMDYFVFPRGVFGEIPPLAIGRTVWDQWLVFRARSLGVPVVDATRAITAVHQDHGYAHPQGAAGIWQGPEARRNLALASGGHDAFMALDADWRLGRHGVRRRFGWALRSLSRSLRRLAARR